ncbi:heme transporter hrg1-A-like [Dreissena polymorpha]|uniref:Heme transporter hrg-1 n=1 Tax=Dreissena polymorpha TaxID=45954 RepID=A0A9D4RQU6_DREPO|nr:heme transporter hrg1-A-like [Dreissena polymorpha]KAH3878131.1 hypothetical protein DPMN_002015 [Dreissena polymorpha]
MAAPGERKYTIRLVYVCVGIFIGLSVAATFAYHFHNFNTALWGLCSAVPAAIALIVVIGWRRQWWEVQPGRLRGFMLVGCFIQLAGVCGFVTYLTLAITKKQGLVIYGEGYYLACVWCFMTWKWAFLLFLYSRQYWRAYSKERRALTDPDHDTTVNYGT